MRENCTTLYPNEAIAAKVSDYADKHSLALSSKLVDYHGWVLATQPRSYYTISTLEARYLSWTARLMGAKRVLEIGVFVGFSVAAWADAVGPDGKVTGLEKSPEYAKAAREKLAATAWDNTEVIEGDALEILPTLKSEAPFDIIFIDAQKSGYPVYLGQILANSQAGSASRLLRKGGLIIGDNSLRSALVVDQTEANPASATVPRQTENWNWTDVEKLDAFNSEMRHNARLESVLLPVFDGLTMGCLVD